MILILIWDYMYMYNDEDLWIFQIDDFFDKVNFYVMGCVFFFKSFWLEIKSNVVLFVGKNDIYDFELIDIIIRLLFFRM